jgi:predicted TIM-barrel fold metal-dependent hydrolase
MRDLGYPVFDADNHLYEAPEALLDHLPKKHAREIQFVQVRGRTKIAVRGRLTEYMPNPTFERVARPGAHAAYYRGTNAEGKTLREMTGDPIPCSPAFREPGPRLALLDQLGVARALMFPTLANLIEYTASDDPELTHAAIHAINSWLHERWSFEFAHRIFTVPVLTLAIVEAALGELDWMLARGARAIAIRPAPANGLRGMRSIALPEFDPIWARIQEADLLVCLHAAFPPLTPYYEQWEPGRSDSAFEPTPTKLLLLQHREVEDALAAMVCQGLFTRFPRLKVLSVENGADWVPHLMQQLQMAYGRMPQAFGEPPLEAFRRNVYVNPFWENNVAELVGLLGTDRVLFGSDYPHPEGMAEPLAYLDVLDALPELDALAKRRIMSDNGHALLGVRAD